MLAAGMLAAVASPPYTRADVTLPVTGDDIGATNPVGAADTNVFRDDEVALGHIQFNIPWDYAFWMTIYALSDDLMNIASWGTVTGGLEPDDQNEDVAVQTAADCRNLGSAFGRIQNPHNDQAAVAFFRPDGQVRVQRWGFNGEPRRESLLAGTTLTRRSVDVAVGDLDLVVDDEGYFHDEVVVARTANVLGSQCNVQVDVLDYDLSVIASQTIAYASCANYVATTIGDFDGDSKLEIAVAMNGDSAANIQVAIGRLVDGVLIFGAPLPIPRNHAGVDLTSGDFAGTGREQIVAVTGVKGLDIFVLESSLYDPINPDSVPPLLLKSHSNGANDYSSYTRVVSGLFIYDPAKGYDFGRRQFALATLDSNTKALKTYLYVVDKNYVFTISASHSQTQSGKKKIYKLDLAAGNFVGHGQSGQSTSPAMDLVAAFLTDNGNTNDDFQYSHEWRVLKVADDGSAITPAASNNWRIDGWDLDVMYDPFVLPVDTDGDSWRLGIPIHIVTDTAISYNSLLEEPPKHVDYLPLNPDDLSKGFDVVNISGYKSFYVALKQISAQGISTEKTDTTNWSVGGGAELGGDFQVNLGRANNPKVRLDVNADAKFSRSHDESTKDINAHYISKSVSWTNSTDADDELDVSFQDVDIWRYPIIGFETGDASNPMGYYEILIPGKSWGGQTGGKQYDWYAPSHVNDNVLSYPQTRTSELDWLPSDVGPFEVPVLDAKGNPMVDDDGHVIMKTETGLLASQTVYTWDGNKHTLEMQFNKTDKTSYQTTFSNTWSGSGDIGLGLSSKIAIPKPGVPLSFSLEGKAKLSASGHTSWGGETMGSTEMSESSGVTLEIPAIVGFSQEGRSYSFTTAVYASTNGGGHKVAHTVVGLTENASDWWVKQYGRAPDPALNLPFLFRQNDPDPQHANLNWWELKTEENDDFDTRHQMRGFLMRNNERDEATGDYELFSGNPVDGETVRLCARVYNFSLGQATGNFYADFYYYGWDKRIGKEVDPKTGLEVHQPIGIGKATVPSIDSLSTIHGTTMREVCVPWDTTGLSVVANADIRYRFLVNLDENDDVKGEIHELRDAQGKEAPGGNNSGRWPWEDGILVDPPQTATAAEHQMRLVHGVLEDTRLDVNFWLAEGDLAIETAAGFVSGEPVVIGVGEECRIRARIVSDRSYSGNVWAVFFDGKPNEGGKLIGITLVRGLREGDNYAWAHWTPEESGEHELRAYAFHRVSYANREGGTTWRMATVASKPSGGGGSSDGCSLTGGTAYGSVGLLGFGLFWLGMKRLLLWASRSHG